jgi:hypothetical protein
LFGVSAGMHDHMRRQIAAQQPIVRRSDGEVSAQQIEPLIRAEIFADREVEGRAVACRQRRAPAAVMHDVTGIARQQQDVTGLQLQRPARTAWYGISLASPGPCSMRHGAP